MDKNLKRISDFYFKEFTPIYDYLNAKLKHIPSELHFEIAAAFDHIMRAEQLEDNENEANENFNRAIGHLKRASFDAFKLLYKHPLRDLWVKLSSSKYSDVDNGEFIGKVNDLWYKASDVVTNARGMERHYGHKDNPEHWDAIFSEWRKLIDIMKKMEELDVSPGAKRARMKYIRTIFVTIILFIATQFLAFSLNNLYQAAFNWVRHFFQ